MILTNSQLEKLINKALEKVTTEGYKNTLAAAGLGLASLFGSVDAVAGDGGPPPIARDSTHEEVRQEVSKIRYVYQHITQATVDPQNNILVNGRVIFTNSETSEPVNILRDLVARNTMRRR